MCGTEFLWATPRFNLGVVHGHSDQTRPLGKWHNMIGDIMGMLFKSHKRTHYTDSGGENRIISSGIELSDDRRESEYGSLRFTMWQRPTKPKRDGDVIETISVTRYLRADEAEKLGRELIEWAQYNKYRARCEVTEG